MLTATPDQLERLIEAGEALEAHAREWADELTALDNDDGELYGCAIEEMESDIARFNAIRREIDGIQHTMGSV